MVSIFAFPLIAVFPEISVFIPGSESLSLIASVVSLSPVVLVCFGSVSVSFSFDFYDPSRMLDHDTAHDVGQSALLHVDGDEAVTTFVNTRVGGAALDAD